MESKVVNVKKSLVTSFVFSTENGRSANVGVAFVGVLSEQERRIPHQGRRCRAAQRGQGLLRSQRHESSRDRSRLDFH